jgi:hypothetical protein
MRLSTARLCLDCDEVHDARQCPVCASETFAYITRWVPLPERRPARRETSSPEADIYRQLVGGEQGPPRGRLLKRAALGLTALGLAGWLWRRGRGREADEV